MTEPTGSSSAEEPGTDLVRGIDPGLFRVPLGDMTPEQVDEVKRLVIAEKAAGVSWNTLVERWPLLSVGTMRTWWRVVRYAPVDNRPEAIREARLRQAAEVRWLLEQTFQRIEELTEATSREGIETDTDRFNKLAMVADRLHKREASLLGLDAPVRMELDQRVKLDWAPELEALVGELAGGGLLQSDAGEILDGEVLDDE